MKRHPSPLQPPKSDFNPVPGRKGASQEGDYRGMGETRRPPWSLAICTSWDPVSCEEAAPCSDPSGPRHWALALEEFGKGTEGSFVNNLTHTLRPGSLCTVQGPVGLPVSRPLCPSFLFFFLKSFLKCIFNINLFTYFVYAGSLCLRALFV